MGFSFSIMSFSKASLRVTVCPFSANSLYLLLATRSNISMNSALFRSEGPCPGSYLSNVVRFGRTADMSESMRDFVSLSSVTLQSCMNLAKLWIGK